MKASTRFPLPPIGTAMVLAPAGDHLDHLEIHHVNVQAHLGRFFIAGGIRFHSADDRLQGPGPDGWANSHAVIHCLPPGADLVPTAAIISAASFQPMAAAIGQPEPTEAW